jgi:hypothetical protein
MQAKWDEMFGVKGDVDQEVKLKKPRKKTLVKKKQGSDTQAVPESEPKRKNRTTTSKAPDQVPVATKKTTKKPKATNER